MRLLIFTQKVDSADPILGFMVGWIKSLAGKAESVIAVCLEKGEFNLPDNVRVFSLGKETGQNKLKYLFNFYRLIWQERKNYNAVFVHMNQIYVILGGWFWGLFQKPVALWYAHGSVSWSLRLATRIVNLVLTSSPAGFRISSPKVRVIGQGIDTDHFSPSAAGRREEKLLINVGRISRVKKQIDLVEALSLINDKDYQLNLIGAPITTDDTNYAEKLSQKVAQLGLDERVDLIGAVKPIELIDYLRPASLFVTMSQTGSFDKAVLEAMATGLIPIVANPTFRDLLGELSDQLIIEPKPEALVDKILFLNSLELEEKENLRTKVRQIVVNHHSLNNLTAKIVAEIKKCQTT